MNNSAAHTRLMTAIRIALGKLPECDFEPLTNFAGRTDRGTFIQAGMCPGAADLIGQVLGRRCDLEVKTGKARQSADQKRWQARIRRGGGVCEVVRSVDDALAVVRGVVADVRTAEACAETMELRARKHDQMRGV